MYGVEELDMASRRPSTKREAGVARPPREAYIAPPSESVYAISTAALMGTRRAEISATNELASMSLQAHVWACGDRALLEAPCVAIVGTRSVSPNGAARARRLAKALAEAGVTVVSGLAKGVDTEALTAAMQSGGRVAAVIGTPLDRAYPAENKKLQEEIYRDHLLVSQFSNGERVFPSNFPLRNRLMALVTDASVIIEAGETSGTIHQASECARLGRPLFIAQSVASDPRLAWPSKFLGKPGVFILNDVSDVLAILPK